MTTKKADYIWFNGEMVRWEDAKVHVMSHALHYGTSVFEGIRCYDSHKGPVVFRHREHMQRLRDSAKIYRFPVSQSIDELMETCREVIRKNNLTSAYIRPLVFVGDVGMGVNPPPGYTTDVIIAAFPWGHTWVPKRWIRGSMRWFLPGIALRRTPFQPPPKRAGTIFPHCWWVAKRAATAIRKASPWM
ncbi:branched-chain amino acid aminotransferase [Salmonella enterica subsp. enterica]|nr:branched-chain amino acid aminotransferase [Salmonella enterica subsp. enterica]